MTERDFKARRKALGLSRAELGEAAHVDRRIIQLLELGHQRDEEAESRLTRAMDALENGEELPDFKTEVAALRRSLNEDFVN